MALAVAAARSTIGVGSMVHGLDFDLGLHQLAAAADCGRSGDCFYLQHFSRWFSLTYFSFSFLFVILCVKCMLKLCTYYPMNVSPWLMLSVCCGWAVSDSCSRGSAKDFSGENLQKLIETGQLYVFFLRLIRYCIRAVKYADLPHYCEKLIMIFDNVIAGSIIHFSSKMPPVFAFCASVILHTWLLA